MTIDYWQMCGKINRQADKQEGRMLGLNNMQECSIGECLDTDEYALAEWLPEDDYSWVEQEQLQELIDCGVLKFVDVFGHKENYRNE